MEELVLRDSVQRGIGDEAKPSGSSQVVDNGDSAPVNTSLIDEKLKVELSQIPDKMAFKIGEVAEMLDIKSYVLRYWETEFERLKPKKSNSNQRMYSRKDVEMAFLIKKLLYRDRYSIEGARKAIRDLKGEVKETRQWDQVAGRFDRAIEDLESLIATIKIAKTHF